MIKQPSRNDSSPNPYSIIVDLLKTTLLVLLGTLLTYIIVAFIKPTHLVIWILLLWFATFLITGCTTKRLLFRVVSVNLAMILLIFGAFEAYFQVELMSQPVRPLNQKKTESPIHTEGSGSYVRGDEILGYAAKKNSEAEISKYFNDELLYHAKYTIGNNGLRISPETERQDASAILFFGGSFTFGEGVNNEETMPYATGILVGDEYAVYNFALNGYGVQHMLAMIEHGVIDAALKHKPKYAIYQAIPQHVNRMKNIEGWLKNSPRYILDANGNIVKAIKGDTNNNIRPEITFWSRMNADLREYSYLYKKLHNRYKEYIIKTKRYWIDHNDIKTYVSAVDKFKNLLVTKYPEIEFHVICWDEGENRGYSEAIIESMTKKQLKIHRLSNIKDRDDPFNREPGPRQIPHDWHPTPLLHRIIASYVANEIIMRNNK